MQNNSWADRDTIRILFVDDEWSQAELAKINLEWSDSSISVTTSNTAQDALERLADRMFDCVVSDYQIPV